MLYEHPTHSCGMVGVQAHQQEVPDKAASAPGQAALKANQEWCCVIPG